MKMSKPTRRNGRVTMLPNDPKRQRKPRRVVGMPPEAKDVPYTIACFDESFRQQYDATAQRWLLSVMCRRCDPRTGWLSMKLHATTVVRLKANFWLGWSTRELRFAHRGDHSALRELRPELYEAVEQFLWGVTQQYQLTASMFNQAQYRIGGVDQKELLPIRGIVNVSRHRRDGSPNAAIPLFIRKGLANGEPSSAPRSPEPDNNPGDISDLL